MLYFENLSSAKEDEYLRDGMTEDIITELANIQGLRVFPRPAMLAYRDKPTTAPQVGTELGAAYVLGGSIRRAGNRLRITAQLVETRSNHTLWGQRYDREMADVFEVQDEIARALAQALRISLSPQEEKTIARKPTENLQAYDYYLRGRSYARRESLEFALQMFEQAIKLDPGFARRTPPLPMFAESTMRPADVLNSGSTEDVLPAISPRARSPAPRGAGGTGPHPLCAAAL